MSEADHHNQDGCPLPRPGGRRVLRNSRNPSLQGSQEELSLSKTAENVSSVKSSQEAEGGLTMECAVCLQTCVHPVRLPCSHIFCYLCVKGVAFQSKRCAMCRQDIPADFLLHPQLLDRTQLERETALEDGYQWFYEGRNGWWQYDERTAASLEDIYQQRQRTELDPLVEILIAGATYVIDLERWIQYAKERPGRIRKIKRDFATIVDKLGVAGIRQLTSPSPSPSPPPSSSAN